MISHACSGLSQRDHRSWPNGLSTGLGTRHRSVRTVHLSRLPGQRLWLIWIQFLKANAPIADPPSFRVTLRPPLPNGWPRFFRTRFEPRPLVRSCPAVLRGPITERVQFFENSLSLKSDLRELSGIRPGAVYLPSPLWGVGSTRRSVVKNR